MQRFLAASALAADFTLPSRFDDISLMSDCRGEDRALGQISIAAKSILFRRLKMPYLEVFAGRARLPPISSRRAHLSARGRQFYIRLSSHAAETAREILKMNNAFQPAKCAIICFNSI